MTNQHYELRLSACGYYNTESLVVIPSHYYDHIINAFNNNKLEWNPDQAASLVLLSAFFDGVLLRSDLTVQGYHALKSAEKYLKNSTLSIGKYSD